jgi:cytochrome c-type biogenesis protein CcmH/NrfG
MRRVIPWILLSCFFLAVFSTSCKNPQLSGGILHFDQKRYERARQTLLTAVKQEPANAEAYLWLGKAYAELDSTAQARVAFDKASSLESPKFPTVKTEAANALEHYWSLRHNEGLNFAKTANDAKINDKAAEATQNFRLALNQFKKARVYEPRKEETPRNMGVCYIMLGEVDSGLVALKESASLAPPGDSKSRDLLFDKYRQLGDQAAERGDTGLNDAIRFYSEAENLRPEDPDLLFSLGVVYYQIALGDSAGQKEKLGNAVDYFDRTLKVKPDDQEALYNAASLDLELQKCEAGIEKARTLLDLDPHKGRNYDLVGRLSDCLGNKGDRIQGILFKRALDSGDIVPLDDFRAHLEKWGPGSDTMRRYREEGKPEEVRSFKDTSGREYECWFFYTRGKAYIFSDGTFKYETSFKAEKPKEE